MGNLDPTAEEFKPRRNPNHLPLPPPPPPTTPFPYPYSYYPFAVSTFSYAGGYETLPYPPFCYGEPLPYPPPAHIPSTPQPPLLPTRSLLLSFFPPEAAAAVTESSVRRQLEIFGDVRGVQMERRCEGTVIVHFYDLRHAETALAAIRLQQQTKLLNPPARGVAYGCDVWAQFTLPARDAVPEGQNQGTVVVFNVDWDVEPETLRQIFEDFGPIKEIRHPQTKKSQRFVEFFDIRDAANALEHMNGKEIHGRPVVIEFSRPGRKFFQVSAASPFSKSFCPSPPPLQPRFWPPFAPHHAAAFSSQPQLSSSKTSMGNHDSRVAMASIHSGEDFQNGVEDGHHSHGPPNRSFVKTHSRDSSVESMNQLQGRSNRPCRGRQARHDETRFLIQEDAASQSGCIDSRTTVMIKNIPNKYSQKLLMNMLDNHCIHYNEQIGDGDDQILSSYDFLYLPIDFNNKCNVGYGFVNMTSPEATLRLYKAFHHQPWEVFNSRKICEVTYARVQGLEALKEHFKNSKFPYEIEHYLPVYFSPPRDGKQVTEPLPVGQSNKHSRSFSIGSHSHMVGTSSEDLINHQNGSVEGDDEDNGCGLS